MKKLLICLILLTSAFISKAQLANTKWSGTMMVPSEQKVILAFKKDSLFIMIDDMAVESMTYSINDSTITANKFDGKSPCDIGPFTLKFLLKGNQLFIKDISDSCNERLSAWTVDPFIKQN